MKIPLLDLKRQYVTIKNEIDQAVSKVFASCQFILGKDVQRLEEEIASYCGAQYGIGVASGTDALLLSLRAFDIGEGEGVITTPYTFFATAGSITRLGAIPFFVDIEPQTYNIDAEKIKEFIETKCEFDPETGKSANRQTGQPVNRRTGKQIKAIIPVHLYGQLANMKPIRELAREYNLKVIEDAAQALGAEYKGRKAGSLGNTGCFSFFPAKNLGGCGDGGMVITNDREIADKIRCLRVHGAEKRYFHSTVGYNSRLDALQATVLRIKLKYLDEWNKKRREHARVYNEAFAHTEIITPYLAPYNTHIYHQYTIRVSRRDELEKYLEEKGIGCALYYPLPLHLQECYRELGYRKGDLPESERAAGETISLPIYPELTREEQDYIIESVKKFL